MAERLDPLSYYPWMWRDWRLSRRVQRMHYVARGFYRELLDEQFAEGFIPDEVVLVAEICGAPLKVMKEHWPAVREFFVEVSPGKLVNEKLEHKRTEIDAKRAIQSIAGKKSAQARLNIRSTDDQPTFNERSTDDQVSPTSRAEQSKAEQNEAVVEPVFVARAVLETLSLAGPILLNNLTDVCSAEMKAGRAPEELRDEMVKAYRDFDAGRQQMDYPPGDEKFFGQGFWKNRKKWPWKEGSKPAGMSGRVYVNA